MSSPLVVNVAELLRRAGSVREIDRQIESEIFKFDFGYFFKCLTL